MADYVSGSLTPDSLAQLWAAGSVTVVPLKGEPVCHLRIDPQSSELVLITPYVLPEPDVARLRHVATAPVTVDSSVYNELSVDAAAGVQPAYTFLMSVAGHLHHGLELAAAVDASVALHRELLAARPSLVQDREIGLFGELLTVEQLVRSLGPQAACSAWKGPLREEHDFKIPGCDLEVKTTSSELRAHRISSLNQLEPRPGVDLHLLSVQITRSVEGDGRTLAAIVADVRAATRGYSVTLDALLREAGWRDEDADLYPTRWSLRSSPATYLVDAAFPRLTGDGVSRIVPNSAALSDITYRVNLAGLSTSVVPALAGLIQSEENQ